LTDRERLVAKIVAQGARAGDVVVSLEDLFNGNNDPGSIGCNLGADQPTMLQFFVLLRVIRDKQEVQDVLVRVCEFDSPASWPYSDTVYILTSAQLDEVQQWVSPLKPDEVHGEWMYGAPPNAPELSTGIKPYSVWWD
jgi:hypothetical protein